MFNFVEEMTIFRELKAHGRKWLQIKYLRDNWYLAVEKAAKSPAPIMMIYVEKDENKKA